MLKEMIPKAWFSYLEAETNKPYFSELDAFVSREYATKTIFPTQDNIFNALKSIDPKNVKVVILGQDPYHEPNQAHGLSFSVQDGVPLPKSLINIYTELQNDLGITPAKSGNLQKWANQGVLLLNSVLTVENHLANSHKNQGWEQFTAAVLKVVLNMAQPKVFILWGKQAKDTFYSVYDGESNIKVITSAHPSPLSAYRGFFGSKPFSKTNQYLAEHHIQLIDWRLN